ncbi:isoamylase early set domain-containing protein [Reinekea sp. G2M2-21]|uniref:isoamylase early set domain-containing protein n=1 Tax=Reinekea sp. G2M2-21 TaxID=2788942 RepID=UPI0018AAD5A8|nr:isoamylase early set domain-containing protein [Reinekea sp. G2M2-21]MDX1340765.1 isoamylase early set domain-containing protein [Reinekea sp.]MDX1474786.1 isoamylase early set domain-containing protein [Reinekea sp.]
MAIKKKFLKSKPVCKCTFTLPKDAAPDAEKVTLVGDFNDWAPEKHVLKKLKSGEFKIDLDLETGKSYQYRFLIDDETWENDWQADDYIPVPEFSTDNSVVCC